MTEAEVIERLRPFARHLSHVYFIAGAERQDVEGEAWLGLVKALRDYQPSRGHFLPFVRGCMERQVQTAVKAGLVGKHRPLTFSARAVENDGERAYLVDLVEARGSDPCDVLQLREEVQTLLAGIANELTPLERRAAEGFIAGLSYAEIGGDPSRHTFKRIDRALTRARTKLRRAA